MTQKYFRSLKISGILIIWAVTLLVYVGCGQDVKAPEPRIALVYSKNYEVSFWGLERLFPLFDLHKYEKIHNQLVKNALAQESDFNQPDQITNKEILMLHSQKFVDSLNDSKMIEKYLWFDLSAFPGFFKSRKNLDNNILKPMRYATGGTLLAARKSLQHGIAINLGGGFHHGGPDEGEGACVYADMPIAIRVLQAEGKIAKALVIDLDAHQGNGTAICLENDDTCYTFSMHQGNIYPIPKEHSDLDVSLKQGMKDDEFLAILERHIDKLFENEKFDIVFYQAGCDTLKGDAMAQLEMSEEGIALRDLRVIDACVKRQIPVIMTLGGGFTLNAWSAQYKSISRIIEKYGLYKVVK